MAGKIQHEKLFVDYLSGESNTNDIQFIETHFTPREQKKIINQILKKYWEDKNIMDQPEKYRKMLENIHKKIEHSPSNKRQFNIDYWYYSKMVASILIFISVIFYFGISYRPASINQPVAVNKIHKSTSFGQKLTVVLPDGSSVVLNSGTTMIYPENFPNNIREVELDGEAFFDVKKDADRPFTVKSGQLDVSVLGTSFNFNTHHATVALTEGKVHLSDGETQINLSPGQLAKFSGSTRIFEIDKINYTEQIGWKDGVINIEDYTVEEVVQILEKWYGVDISIRNIDVQKEFSGKLSHKSLENILQGLCFVLDCKYKINDKNVEIYQS